MSDFNKLLKMGDLAKNRIVLAKIMDTWKLCTSVCFGNSLDVITIYDPPEDSTDMTYFIRRGEACVCDITDTPVEVIDLDDADALKIITGFSIYKGEYPNFREYMKATLVMSLETEIDKINRAMRERRDDAVKELFDKIEKVEQGRADQTSKQASNIAELKLEIANIKANKKFILDEISRRLHLENTNPEIESKFKENILIIENFFNEELDHLSRKRDEYLEKLSKKLFDDCQDLEAQEAQVILDVKNKKAEQTLTVGQALDGNIKKEVRDDIKLEIAQIKSGFKAIKMSLKAEFSSKKTAIKTNFNLEKERLKNKKALQVKTEIQRYDQERAQANADIDAMAAKECNETVTSQIMELQNQIIKIKCMSKKDFDVVTLKSAHREKLTEIKADAKRQTKALNKHYESLKKMIGRFYCQDLPEYI